MDKRRTGREGLYSRVKPAKRLEDQDFDSTDYQTDSWAEIDESETSRYVEVLRHSYKAED